ncbi:MAG: putative transporter transrane protein [Solirubrobacterales bacterium]|nr:putative transporter transrane protein [Solirubrobacterales bacterium]
MATQTPAQLERRLVPPDGPILPDVVRSEFTKFRSVRSTYATLAAAFVAAAALGPVQCALYAARYPNVDAEEKADFSAAHLSLNGIQLAQLAIGVLGVLLISSEYTTGMIRATLAAVPQRRTVLAAKAFVFTIVTLIVSEIACFIAFFASQAFLSPKHLNAHLSDPGVLRAVVGGGLYLAVLGLTALALGTVIRHSAGAIATLFGLLFVLPGIASALPRATRDAVNQYLPSNAGQQIFALRIDPHTLQPWAGLGVFCIYAAIALTAAAILLRRRDA